MPRCVRFYLVFLSAAVAGCQCAPRLHERFALTGLSPSLVGLIDAPPNVISVEEAGRIRAIDNKGAVVWQIMLEGPVVERPALVDGVLIVASSSGQWVGIEASDGHSLWTLAGYPPPALAVEGSREVAVVYAYDGFAYVVRPRDGSFVMKQSQRGPPSTNALLAVSDVGMLVSRNGKKLKYVDFAKNAVHEFSDVNAVSVALTGNSLVAVDASGVARRFALDTFQETAKVILKKGRLEKTDSELWFLEDKTATELDSETLKTKRALYFDDEILSAPIESGILKFINFKGNTGCFEVGTRRAALMSESATKCVDHLLKGRPIVHENIVFIGPRDGRVLGFDFSALKKHVEKKP